MVALHDVTAGFDASAPNAPAAPGFAVLLPCAQLGDLIQINCINRVRGVFRVCSAEGEGFLFFEGGQLVHATCRDEVGLDAVVSMLGWRGGSIEPIALPWPLENSIAMGADALLLHAAQRLDERTRDATEHEAARALAWRVAQPDEGGADREPSTAAERSREQSGIRFKNPFAFEGLSRLEVTRVAPDGTIERLKPGASTELADTAFHCQRLATLVGEGLGLGPCRALACESSEQGLVVFQGRSIVGARGRVADLEFVLAKVGLG